MSLDRDNKAYDNLGMSDSMKSKIYNKCMEKRKNEESRMEINSFDTSSDSVESRECTTIMFDTSDLVRVRKKSSVYENVMRCVASIVIIAILSSILFLGNKYLNSMDKSSRVLKNATTEYMFDEEERLAAIRRTEENELEEKLRNKMDDFLHEDYSEVSGSSIDYKRYIKECYDSNGKLKEGYEEREFDLVTNRQQVNKIKLVGKDFVYISAKEVKNNIENYREEFLSELGDEEIEKAKMLFDDYIDDFARYDLVYYLQGDNLIRVCLEEDPIAWIHNGECYETSKGEYTYYKFVKLKKANNKVIAFRNKTVTKKLNKEENKEFSDSNLMYGNQFQVVDKKTEKKVKDINYLYIKPVLESGKNILYYVDEDFDLWRIENVDFYKNDDGDTLVEYNHNEECNGQIKTVFGVDKDYKAEKIAEKVYTDSGLDENISSSYSGGFVIKENVEVYKLKGFKMLLDDEHVIYKD